MNARPVRRAAAFACAFPFALAAQSGEDWAAGLVDLSPGFHTVEVDSLYAVSGSNRADVLRDMERNGPGSDEIGIRLGLHVSQWRYSYEFVRDGSTGRCRLTEAQVLLRSIIVTPVWTNVSAAPREESRGWRPFLEALRRHEEGHRNRAKAQGVFLWQALLGLQARDCDELERRASSTAERVLEEGRAEQRAYDRETGHGAAQGAVWPQRAARRPTHRGRSEDGRRSLESPAPSSR